MRTLFLGLLITVLFTGCTTTDESIPNTSAKLPTSTKTPMTNLDVNKAPAQNFDLTKWKLNIPMEDDKPKRRGKVMQILPEALNHHQRPYSHPEWFYTDKQTGAMVFKAPNKAMTTPNSKSARSELRAMLATGAKDPKNNFVIAAHPDASDYGAIGGRLSAILAVDWVSTSGSDRKKGAFATVVGQIHASRSEPLKIVYRKLPEHEFGSLTWNYEINASGDNYAKRKDIRHDVFGQYGLRHGDADPIDGIKLGARFSYDVRVEGNMMYLTFKKNVGNANEIKKTYALDLAKGNYKGNEYDEGYANDWMYFKAGNYNLCNVSSSKCSNNGIAAGDYAQVSFYALSIEH